MDVPLLRTLTEMSPMRFGKYREMRVGDLIKMQKNRYLRWVYFNIAGVSFADDVLQKIGVLSFNDSVFDYRIEKPGIDPERNEALNKLKMTKMQLRDKSHVLSRDRKIKKQYLVSNERSTNETKRVLQARNHGRY